MSDVNLSPNMLLNRIVHYAVVAVLVFGGLYYVWTELPAVHQPADQRTAEALALVQSQRALGFPTILEAMNDHVRSMKARGQGVRLGDWRVKHIEDDIYEVRVQLRDQGVRGQWFEREFIWHAHLNLKRVNAASLAADGLTPKAPDEDQRTAPPAAKGSG